jgi:polyferredoxin
MQKPSKPRTRRDNVYLGAFLGLIFPVIGFLLYYLFMFSDNYSLQGYWDFLFSSGNISAALSLAIILNLPVFLFNLSNNNYHTVRGVVGVTIFYGVLIIIFKFL